jgi:hypothetical protein
MLNGCGMNTWTTNSIIRHAVADKPAGPFAPREIIMEPFAHNPTAIQAPDGTYLIYHIGCGTPNGGKPCTDCKGGNTGKSCRGIGEMVACSKNTTNILHSTSLDGPWEQLNAPIINSATMGTPYQIDNPTVTFFKNGSLLLLGEPRVLNRPPACTCLLCAALCCAVLCCASNWLSTASAGRALIMRDHACRAGGERTRRSFHRRVRHSTELARAVHHAHGGR